MQRNQSPPARIRAASTGSTRLPSVRSAWPTIAGADFGLAVDTARAHGGDAVNELGLAYGAHILRVGGANHRAGLHEHRRDDVVTAVGIGQQLVEQIAPAWAVPEMMMRIDDRKVRLEDRFIAPSSQSWRTGI
jgi:hypothetical protein